MTVVRLLDRAGHAVESRRKKLRPHNESVTSWEIANEVLARRFRRCG